MCERLLPYFRGVSAGHVIQYKSRPFSTDRLGQAVQAIDAYFADLFTAQKAISGQLSTELRISCVRANKERAQRKLAKLLIGLVEPWGIEPQTSTMPL